MRACMLMSAIKLPENNYLHESSVFLGLCGSFSGSFVYADIDLCKCIIKINQVDLPEQILFACLRPILYVLDEHRPQYYDP